MPFGYAQAFGSFFWPTANVIIALQSAAEEKKICSTDAFLRFQLSGCFLVVQLRVFMVSAPLLVACTNELTHAKLVNSGPHQPQLSSDVIFCYSLI